VLSPRRELNRRLERCASTGETSGIAIDRFCTRSDTPRRCRDDTGGRKEKSANLKAKGGIASLCSGEAGDRLIYFFVKNQPRKKERAVGHEGIGKTKAGKYHEFDWKH